MGSNDEDHIATVYGEEFLDEEEDDESEEQNQHVDEDDVDLIDDEDDEEEEDDSTSSAAGVLNATTTVAATPTTTTSIARSDPILESKKPAAIDDSRRLFQRLWTDEDEIELLQGFLDYNIQRNSSHHHHDTAAFYDQIRGKLQLDFNKNQLFEKIRRLKKKYRNVIGKISSGKDYVFKSPHDQATFDISCKIWSETLATTSTPAAADIADEEPPNPNFNFNLNDHNGNEIADPNYSEKKVSRSRKRSRSTFVKFEENYYHQQQSGQNVTPNLVEEALKCSLLPLFKEWVNNSRNPFGGSMNLPIGDMTDDKWRKQHILELEVYSKRLDLMQDHIKSKLEELKSMGN